MCIAHATAPHRPIAMSAYEAHCPVLLIRHPGPPLQPQPWQRHSAEASLVNRASIRTITLSTLIMVGLHLVGAGENKGPYLQQAMLCSSETASAGSLLIPCASPRTAWTATN
jgi:hypothetical protein